MSRPNPPGSARPRPAAVWTFFYGSYINFDVLKEVDMVPQSWEVARLGGFDIRIEPRATSSGLTPTWSTASQRPPRTRS